MVPTRPTRMLQRLGLASLLLVLVACGGDTTSADDDAALPAPAGMRWVGEAGVVVAVPDWWSVGETRCGVPAETTVYADAAATYECADPVVARTVREVSHLGVLDATCCTGEQELRGMVPVPGRDDLVERPGCAAWLPGECRHLFAVSGTDVVFAVTTRDDAGATWQEIRDSARTLPAHLTTVPLSAAGHRRTPAWGAEPPAADDYAEALRAAGLEVERETAEREDDGGDYGQFVTGSLLEVAPRPGSVVERGATVTLTVSGESLS